MLTWAEPLHAVYNLVLFDFRNHGQSSGDVTTLGVREARDLKAVVDWLERAKAPSSIAVLGVSMGGAATIDEATTDDRVAAVILDSTTRRWRAPCRRRSRTGACRWQCPARGRSCWAACYGREKT